MLTNIEYICLSNIVIILQEHKRRKGNGRFVHISDYDDDILVDG
jgi:hypothetical protein